VPRQGGEKHPPNVGHVQLEARANRILDAALALLQRWGYRKTTLEDIARQAGVTKGTVYQHWNTRESLFEALLQREYLTFLVDFRERIAADPHGALLSSLIRHLVVLTTTHPLLKAVFQEDTAMLGDLIRTRSGQQLIPARLMVSEVYLEDLRARGLVRTNTSVDTQMKMITAIYLGFFFADQVLPPDRRFLPDEMADGLVETIHRTFELEDTPSPEVIEEARRPLLHLMDQFIETLKTVRSSVDDERSAV
jgi:AcrR family transcriptional regulator